MGRRYDLKGKRILVVEDNPILAFSVELLMQQSGAVAIGPAYDLASAAELSGRNAIDGAVLDINLGEDKVWPLAMSLFDNGVALLFLSANCNDEDFPECLRACPRLDKPAREDDILRVMTAAIG